MSSGWPSCKRAIYILNLPRLSMALRPSNELSSLAIAFRYWSTDLEPQ